MKQEEKNTPTLGSILPVGQLYVRIYLLTQTEDIVQAYKNLCDMGYVEHADLVLLGLLAGDRRTDINKIPHPLNEIPYKCTAVSEDSDKHYLIMITKRQDTGEENLYCYAYYTEVDKQNRTYTFVRACNEAEYSHVKKIIKPFFEQLEEIEEIQEQLGI